MLTLYFNLIFSMGCGGWMTEVSGLTFKNVYTKAQFRWDWDIILLDLDGSLTGKVNDTVVAADNMTINDPSCRSDPFMDNGLSCSNKKGFIRVAFDKLTPDLVLLANVTNANHQMATSPMQKLRLTHPYGWMFALEANQVYTMVFDEALYPTNISYTGTYYSIKPGEYLIMQHIMHKKPDVVTYGNENVTTMESLEKLTSDSPLGSWYWDNSTNTLRYICTLRLFLFVYI